MTDQASDQKPSAPQGASPPQQPEEDDQLKQNKKEKKEFDIDIFRDWCKCCGICAAFCPRHCIKLDEEGAPVIEESDGCTGCGWCEVHCPDFAISVHRRKPAKAHGGADDID